MSEKPSGFDRWRRIAREIEANPGVVLILGAIDTGKSTLAKLLIDRWCQAEIRTAMVETDLGQPIAGPPTVLHLFLLNELPPDMEALTSYALSFVGTTSPHGHILEIVAGARKMVDWALKKEAQIVLVDTCGLVSGYAGFRLKFHKIDLLNPKHLLALQRRDELEHLLRPFEAREGMAVHRLPVSSDVQRRSREKRQGFREKRFRDYFQKARPIERSLDQVASLSGPLGLGTKLDYRDRAFISQILETEVCYGEIDADRISVIVQGPAYFLGGLSRIRGYFNREAEVFKKSDLLRLLVGLDDRNNNTQALGIIEDLDFESENLTVRTPLEDRQSVQILHFGSIRLDPSGRELPSPFKEGR